MAQRNMRPGHTPYCVIAVLRMRQACDIVVRDVVREYLTTRVSVLAVKKKKKTSNRRVLLFAIAVRGAGLYCSDTYLLLYRLGIGRFTGI